MKKTTSETIIQANVANIIKKIKSGKTISAREQELATKFLEEQEEGENPEVKDLCVNIMTVAKFFDMSDRQIRRWVNLGMPKEDKGIYDLKKCFDWWKENITPQVTEEEKEIRKRYWMAKAEGEEIKVSRLKALLIPKEDIIGEFTQRASDLKTTLRALKYRLSGTLEGKNREEIMQILSTEIDEMLRNFCRTGSYLAKITKKKKRLKKLL